MARLVAKAEPQGLGIDIDFVGNKIAEPRALTLFSIGLIARWRCICRHLAAHRLYFRSRDRCGSSV